MDETRELLRHTLAMVAYRGGKAVRDAPAGFAGCRAGDTSQTGGEILAHVGDLFDWALALAEGQHVWHDSKPLAWDREVARFFKALAAFDGYLADKGPLGFPAEKLFQGPIADSLTHIKADISAGHVDAKQPAPRREFD